MDFKKKKTIMVLKKMDFKDKIIIDFKEKTITNFKEMYFKKKSLMHFKKIQIDFKVMVFNKKNYHGFQGIGYKEIRF